MGKRRRADKTDCPRNGAASSNNQLRPLSKIKNLRNEKPNVNCTTCHHGQTKPALNVELLSDSLASDRALHVKRIKAQIAGKEKMTVDSVFKNLKYIGGFEAEILPEVMNKWSIALGVSCNYCHAVGEWESDAKREKVVARQMAEFSQNVNMKLREIKNIRSKKPTVNCATCHRGEIKPALDLKTMGNEGRSQ